MPEDTEYTEEESVEEPELLNIFGEEEPPSEDAEEDSSTDNSDTEPETEQEEDQAEGETEAEPSPTKAKLLAGRFKSVEELERAYGEADKKLATMGTELGSLRKLAADTGNDSLLFENLDSLRWQQDDTGSEELYARRGQRDYVKDSEGNVYLLDKSSGEWKNRNGVPYWTEYQWDKLSEKLEEDFTDEDGNIDHRGLAREVSKIRAAKERERLQALANVKQQEPKPDQADEEGYTEEVRQFKDTLLSRKFAGVENAESILAPYFEETETILKQVEPALRLQPGSYKAALTLVLASKLLDEESEDLPEIFGIRQGSAKTVEKQKKRVVVTENGSRGSAGSSARNDTPKLSEY